MAQQPFSMITPQARWIKPDGTPTPAFFRTFNSVFVAVGSGQAPVDLSTLETEIAGVVETPFALPNNSGQVSVLERRTEELRELFFSQRRASSVVATSGSLSAIGANTILGNPTGSLAVPIAVTVSTGLNMSGTTITANYEAGLLTGFGTGLTLSGGTLTPAYQAATLTTIGAGLTLTAGTLTSAYQASTITTIGTGLSLTSGVLTATAAISRDYIAGLILSNDSTTPNSVLDIAAGQATDSTNAVTITLGVFTKSTAGVWASGSGSHGMGTGLTIANSTWYHVFAIINAGSADVYFDTSVTAANAPASTTAFRRIGSFVTDGSGHIVPFAQVGDRFTLATPVSSVTANTFGVTTAVTATLSVPVGVVVTAFGTCLINDASTSAVIYISAFTAADDAASISAAFNLFAAQNAFASGLVQAVTNTLSSVRMRVASTTTEVWFTTLGWLDQRGKDA